MEKTFAERILEKNARNIKLSSKERIYDFLSRQDNPVTFSDIQALFQPHEKGYAGQDKRRRELNRDLRLEGKKIECKRHKDNTFWYQIVKIPEPVVAIKETVSQEKWSQQDKLISAVIINKKPNQTTLFGI